ncbi:MAG: Ni/Fe hydrogenase subunit alpha [Gammaproteobacteria bacterium]|jgi:coenzyme F420-reducing hydrogenase alpha subunit
MTRKTIKVDYLARVEGEGALHIKINGTRVEEARLEIFEPPRFFEAFLEGRDLNETPDIVARICGICPVAYQMSAVHALEHALGIAVSEPVRALRRLLYCGEWIESHVLHIYMLHAPDFLGFDGAVEMAQEHPGIVERGLQLKKAGNAIISLLGGREIHPINVRVGGFYRAPSRSELATLTEPLKWAREAAIETVRWAAALPFPDFHRDYEFVALRHPDEYPMNEGRIVSSAGLDIAAEEFDEHFEERHVPHSTALQAALKARGAYFVGPMARFNLNRERLAPIAGELAAEAALETPCTNPFKSIVIRALEVLHACDEALRLIADYTPPDQSATAFEPAAGIGMACTEAPRGLLYHRYEIAADGILVTARIVPPTSQNQATIEHDLRDFVESNLNLSDQDLKWRCEQSIRNYDPCISCATHFLKLDIERLPGDDR